MSPTLLKKERFASVQKAQAGIAKLLAQAEAQGTFVRVLRHNRPIGVLLPNKTWESLLEDLEAYGSPRYLKTIAASRASTKRYSAREAKRLLKLS